MKKGVIPSALSAPTASAPARKVLHNGQLVLIRDGVCYDLLGNMIHQE